MADGKVTDAGGKKSWRSTTAAKNDSVPEHRWQSDERETAPLHTRRSSVKLRLRILGLCCIIVALSAFFLLELLFSRPRTPMIVVAPTDYELPFQPLPWSYEDLEGFRELDRETLNIQAIDSRWKTKDEGLRQVDAQLQNVVRKANRPQTLVLYLRMHSAVDGWGVPCLVPPGASPFNSDSWLPVKDILERIRVQNVPDSISKLIVLDCGSVLVNWNQGIIFNTFAARLPEVVSAARIPNLAVITAAGPAELAATSGELGHGVFGHYLQKGLEGAADDRDVESGNANRLVSVRELHRYLLHHVNDWSMKNRGSSQRPQLIPADSLDFDVATVLNPKVRRRSKAESRLTADASETVPVAEINQLWKKLEECQSLDPLRFDPLAWTEFEQRLRWLEIASESGKAYSRAARRLCHDLQQRVAAIDQLNKDNRAPRTALAQWATFTNKPLMSVTSARMSTLPLAEFFATIEQTSSANFNSILAQFKKSPSAASLQAAVQSLSENTDLAQLELTCLLRLWQRYNVIALWPDPTVLTSVVELHELAESASVPNDERTLDWISPLIEKADALRRNIDDRIFLGGELSPEEISDARRLYTRASQIADDVSGAYAIRDRLDHDVPYLAQWLTRPPLQGAIPSSPFLDTIALLFDLSRNQMSLDQELSRPDVPIRGDVIELPFQGLLRNIGSQHEHLIGLFSAEYERLLQTEDIQATTWNDVQALLSVPILPPENVRLALSPSQQRKLLQEKFTHLNRRLADRVVSATKDVGSATHATDQPVPPDAKSPLTPADPVPASQTMHIAEYLNELLVKVPENLALAIIHRDQKQIDEIATMTRPAAAGTSHDIEVIAESQGRRLRMLLSSVPEAVQSDNEQQMTSHEDRVFQNAFAERIVRSSASVDPNHMPANSIELRRNSDLQHLLLWHSRRTLDDFWGRSSLDVSSFFDVTASHLMKMAISNGMPTTRTQTEVAMFTSLLKKYRTAAANGLATVSDNLLVADDSEPVVAKIAVYQSRQQESLFPEGRAAVFVRNSDGARLGEIGSLTIPWAVGGDPNTTAAQFDVTLNELDHRARPVDLKAVTSFRGHDFVGDLTVNSMEGVVIDYVPTASRESQITVRGRSLRKLSIVFVLDCSSSMGMDLPLETKKQSGSRLQVAKLALESMLDRLAEDENHRVGVICFGHRIGWDLKQAGQLLRQPEYRAPIPDQIQPFDDVETILPLGRFNASFEGDVKDRLASIKPWGESPLYLALIQALKQFDNDEEDSDKSIVVITDGMNYQFNPPAGARKSINDVFEAWNEHRVPIHIVGLGIAADQADAAQREFGEVARKTNGSYVQVQEARTLVESLAALQRVRQFRVDDHTAVKQVADLGQPVVVEIGPHERNEFQVSFGPATEKLELQGGESVELLPTRDNQRLEVLPYEIGQPQFVPLVRDDKLNSATELVVGFHRPLRRGRKVTFEISVQHRMRQFVPRPAEAWIEITPIVQTGRPVPTPYVFYDARYLPETSIPVLQWTVTDWPTEAIQAKIRVWFRPDKSKPAATFSLQEVMDPARNPDTVVAGVPGVVSRIRVRRNGLLQVSVVERHSNESGGVGTLKVNLKSTATPTRVRHRFDAANRIATHFFEFPVNNDVVLQDGEIELTTRTAAHTGAWRIIDPVLIDVTESGDVHD